MIREAVKANGATESKSLGRYSKKTIVECRELCEKLFHQNVQANSKYFFSEMAVKYSLGKTKKYIQCGKHNY